MKKLSYLLLVIVVFSTSAIAYNKEQVKVVNKFYSHITHKALKKSKFFIKADSVMKMLREGKEFTFLDVRTDGEAAIIKLNGENAVHISIDTLFKAQNLNKLPTNKPLIVVCHSGARAIMAAVGLKEIGFKNVQVLKGGLVSLAIANNPKNAPLQD
ncbi:rhodanese-like domain-containing protein [Sulfurimonas sp. SAG-AH-194-L11]|nr:rhodanese-like domain-containing protein [Sulfurimonas sp. SAG-AH-194-L11]MDF1876257.1 rhodanese-like domain-containing protein [Sulfurimonas sp. SAG-AH-194-L11]